MRETAGSPVGRSRPDIFGPGDRGTAGSVLQGAAPAPRTAGRRGRDPADHPHDVHELTDLMVDLPGGHGHERLDRPDDVRRIRGRWQRGRPAGGGSHDLSVRPQHENTARGRHDRKQAVTECGLPMGAPATAEPSSDTAPRETPLCGETGDTALVVGATVDHGRHHVHTAGAVRKEDLFDLPPGDDVFHRFDTGIV